MRLSFGTDGVRGVANQDLTAEYAVVLGRASARVLGSRDWLVGWDTRLSSEMLASAFAAGVASAGAHCRLFGRVPTAAIAYSCRRHNVPGTVVTASHNIYRDNGIKVFDAGGVKLASAVEARIDELAATGGGATSADAVGGIGLGRPSSFRREHGLWLTERARQIDGSGLRIALDCANGAAWQTGPHALRATGAFVSPFAISPDGRNINRDCGSTHLDALRNLVVSDGFDLGLAFDGDADRLLAVDRNGEIADGDQIIGILARDRLARNALPGRGVVVTEWSNLGLLRGLREVGIAVEVCEVGDRAVADAMERMGYALGGEQSGHVILSDLLQVGDGVSTALELVAAMSRAGLPLDELASRAMRKVPQVTRNVPVSAAPELVVRELGAEQVKVNRDLGDRGRLMLRASGTENVVRVMVQADESKSVSDAIDVMVGLLGRWSVQREDVVVPSMPAGGTPGDGHRLPA